MPTSTSTDARKITFNGQPATPRDLEILGQPPLPGQWWVDGAGNCGPVGWGALGNLHQLVAQRQAARGCGSYCRSDITKGSSTFVGAAGPR